jgi:hypothetical protein
VETAPKVDLGSRVPGRLLSLRTRKLLVWAHLALINGISIGEQQALADGPASPCDACMPASHSVSWCLVRFCS